MAKTIFKWYFYGLLTNFVINKNNEKNFLITEEQALLAQISQICLCKGYKVVVFDNNPEEKLVNPIIILNLFERYKSKKSIISFQKCDTLFHLKVNGQNFFIANQE